MGNQTKEQFFTEKFDNDFRSIESEIVPEGIFNRFSRMMPMVGADYEKQPAKILLVLESYYFDNKDLENGSVFTNAENWYKTKCATLIPKSSEKHVNMREDWICNPTEGPYPNIYRSLCALRGGDFESQCRSIAIYNYFLRPAFNNNGSKGFGDKKYCTEDDRTVAFEAFCGVVGILKPDIVVFLSKFSFITFQKHNKSFKDVVIENVSHPSSPWWNKNGGVYGRQKFESLLREHWVKKNPICQKLRTIHNLLFSKFETEIYKPSICGIDKGIYLSCLNLKITDKTFCCQTEIEIKINDVVFWTYFYETDNCEKIPALEDKKYNFTPNFSNDIIVKEIEKLINQIIEEIEKTD